MEYWIELEKLSDENDPDRMINNAVYKRLLPELIKEHEGEWVIISKGELVGIFKTRAEAIRALKTNDLVQNCNIIAPITKKQRRVTLGFGRNVRGN
jgi:urocanate hydratase